MKHLFAATLVVVAVAATAAAGDRGEHPHHGAPLAGLVIFPDQRFDPLVQQLLAREEMRALPIGSSGVLYLYPVTQDPSLLEAQIRYLDQLLQRSGDEPADRQP